MTTTITLDTISFADFATEGWVFSGLTSWFGQTDDKMPVNERPQAHGAFPVSRSIRASRAISFNAMYLGGTQAELEDAGATLDAVGAEGPVLMTVATDAGATWRRVSVELVTPTDPKGAVETDFAVDLIARDSRRYADAAWQSTPPPAAGAGLVWPVVWPAVWPGGGSTGRVSLANTGRAPSAGQFRLNGGFSSALITSVTTGRRIGFDRPVGPGSQVLIDVATMRATIDGQSDVSRFLRWREWENVPPLSTYQYQFDVTDPVGSPTMDGRVFPAWW